MGKGGKGKYQDEELTYTVFINRVNKELEHLKKLEEIRKCRKAGDEE